MKGLRVRLKDAEGKEEAKIGNMAWDGERTVPEFQIMSDAAERGLCDMEATWMFMHEAATFLQDAFRPGWGSDGYVMVRLVDISDGEMTIRVEAGFRDASLDESTTSIEWFHLSDCCIPVSVLSINGQSTEEKIRQYSRWHDITDRVPNEEIAPGERRMETDDMEESGVPDAQSRQQVAS